MQVERKRDRESKWEIDGNSRRLDKQSTNPGHAIALQARSARVRHLAHHRWSCTDGQRDCLDELEE